MLLAAVAAVAGCTPHGTSPSPPPALDARAADVSAPGHGAASAAPIAASGAGGKPGAAPADGPDQVAARAFFAQRCALCHGMDGRGDGPVAKTLRPKPRDYHDAEWQAGVTDDALSRAILHGGAAVGKSAMMPPSPDLADRPEVVAGLVTLIRSFRPN